VKDKVVIVTGGSSGIGLATARLLAKDGSKVVVAARGAEAGTKTTKSIVAEGGDARFIEADMAKESDVIEMVEFTLKSYGRLDGAVNNAGIGPRMMAANELSVDEWSYSIDVNLTGVFLCMKYEMRAMRLSGGGAIVNISSVSGVVGQPLAIEYVASKHGVVGATRAASTEYPQSRVRINAILPGVIMTPMLDAREKAPGGEQLLQTSRTRHSLGHFGQPEDVALAVRFLLSDQAKFINGAALAVDGGYSAR